MNYLDGYVEEVLSEPYYDDYGSGIFRWWVKVSYVCEGIGAVTTLMFDTREEAHVRMIFGLMTDGLYMIYVL